MSLLDMQADLTLNLFPCYTTREAYEIIGTRRVDILFSDIRMPDGNGLDVAAKARSTFSHCKVLMLTAYADFDYARKAIDVSVDGYILKTEDDAHILRETHRVIRELNDELDARQQAVSFRQELDHYKLMYREQMLFHFLRGDHTTAAQRAHCTQTLGFSPDLPLYLTVGKLGGAAGETDRMRLLYVEASMRDAAAPYADVVEAATDGNTVAFILQPKASFSREFRSLLSELMEMVIQSCNNTQSFDISFVLSPPIEGLDRIPEMYTIARAALRKQGIAEEGYVFALAPVASLDTAHVVPRGAQRSAEYGVCLERWDESRFFTLLYQAEAGVRDAGTLSPGFYSEYYAAALALADYTADVRGAPPASQLLDASAHESVADAFHSLRKTAEAFFFTKGQTRALEKERLLKNIDQYIDAHAHQDISLTSISDVMGYNATYLSRIYTRERGITLKKAIMQTKVRRIDQLMRNDTLSLTDICELSGFNSRTYFNAFFRRTFNMNPSQYRTALQAKAPTAGMPIDCALQGD